MRQKALQLTRSTEKPKLPALKKYAEKTRRIVEKIDRNVAEEYVNEAFALKLQQIIQDIKSTDKLTKTDDEKRKEKEKIDKELAKMKTKLANAKSVPRGTWELADRIGMRQGNVQQYGTVQKTLGAGSKKFIEWRNFARDHFDDVSTRTDLRIKPQQHVFSPQLRTCTTKIHKLLRDDLPNELAEKFFETIDDIAVKITDRISDLSFVIRATMLKYASSGHDKFNINCIIPNHAVRDTAMVDDDGYINVSVPTFTRDTEDYEKLFRQEHIQFMHQQYFGRNKTNAAEQHPLWEALNVDCFNTLSKAPTGISQTINSAVQDLAKNIENMMKGSMFEKALEYVTRILLRLLLAPRREASYKQMVRRLAARREERKKQVNGRSIRNMQRKLLYEEKKYYNKCEERILNAIDEDEYQKWQTRRYGSQQRLERIEEEWAKRLERTQASRVRDRKRKNILYKINNHLVC